MRKRVSSIRRFPMNKYSFRMQKNILFVYILPSIVILFGFFVFSLIPRVTEVRTLPFSHEHSPVLFEKYQQFMQSSSADSFYHEDSIQVVTVENVWSCTELHILPCYAITAPPISLHGTTNWQTQFCLLWNWSNECWFTHFLDIKAKDFSIQFDPGQYIAIKPTAGLPLGDVVYSADDGHIRVTQNFSAKEYPKIIAIYPLGVTADIPPGYTQCTTTVSWNYSLWILGADIVYIHGSSFEQLAQLHGNS